MKLAFGQSLTIVAGRSMRASAPSIAFLRSRPAACLQRVRAHLQIRAVLANWLKANALIKSQNWVVAFNVKLHRQRTLLGLIKQGFKQGACDASALRAGFHNDVNHAEGVCGSLPIKAPAVFSMAADNLPMRAWIVGLIVRMLQLELLAQEIFDLLGCPGRDAQLLRSALLIQHAQIRQVRIRYRAQFQAFRKHQTRWQHRPHAAKNYAAPTVIMR
jgi:hypothetical protein